jgi:hypothetical protein
MLLRRLVLGGLNTLQDVIRALREIERASADTLVYLQDSDPGAIGPGRFWITTAGITKIRDLANENWILTSGGGSGGTTWHHGSGVPSNGLGVDGDYYLDEDTGDVYVKSGGVWI